MNIIESKMSINGFSRTGKTRATTLAIVMHNVGVPGQKALAVKAYFESEANRTNCASAHVVIDHDGTIYLIVGEDEKAQHVGSSLPDPVSGKIYTDLARKKFGQYAMYPDKTSPNQCTFGIEMCHGADGIFSEATIQAAIEYVTYLCRKYSLTADDIMTHNDIVGWKECPLLWTKKKNLFAAFKEDVRSKL